MLAFIDAGKISARMRRRGDIRIQIVPVEHAAAEFVDQLTQRDACRSECTPGFLTRPLTENERRPFRPLRP